MTTNGMTPSIFNYDNAADFIEDTSQAIEDFILWKLSEQETFSMALSGGSSPRNVYLKLAKNKKIDWGKIELFMVDERYVSKDSKHSNFNLIEEALLSQAPPVKSFHDFNTILPLEEAAEAYDEMLEKRGNKLFDLVILGMGADGHTASLFPGTEALKERVKLATTCMSPDGMERLTLTFPALFMGEKIMFLIQGKEKKKMVEKVTAPSKIKKTEIPAQMLMKHPNVEIYYNGG